MLIAGLVLFGIGSVVAGLAGSTGQLIAARAGMGVGGALLLTTTLAVAMQIFTPAEHPKAIGIWSAVNALGFAAGPLLGGFMLNHFWWGAIFLINLPVAALGLVSVVALVPESKNPRGDRPDLLGALLSTIGMTALVYAIISGPEHGWTSGRVLATAAVAVLVLAAFAYWESRIPYPMLDLHFFRDRRFTGAVLIAFGMGGALFLLTQHLQFVLGYGPLEAGLCTAPLALAVVALNFSGLSAKWTARLGTPVSIALGMTLMSAGLVSIATLAAHGYGGTLLGLLLIGAGAAVANRHGTRHHERDPTREGGRGRGRQRHAGRVRQRPRRGGARGDPQLPFRGADSRGGGLAPGGAGLGGLGRGARTDHGRVLVGPGDQSAGGRGRRPSRWTAGRGVAAACGEGRLRGGGFGVAPA